MAAPKTVTAGLPGRRLTRGPGRRVTRGPGRARDAGLLHRLDAEHRAGNTTLLLCEPAAGLADRVLTLVGLPLSPATRVPATSARDSARARRVGELSRGPTPKRTALAAYPLLDSLAWRA